MLHSPVALSVITSKGIVGGEIFFAKEPQRCEDEAGQEDEVFRFPKFVVLYDAREAGCYMEEGGDDGLGGADPLTLSE